MNEKITIRPEEHRDYKDIISLILRSFQEGTDYPYIRVADGRSQMYDVPRDI